MLAQAEAVGLALPVRPLMLAEEVGHLLTEPEALKVELTVVLEL
jgi:hypothetical protein